MQQKKRKKISRFVPILFAIFRGGGGSTDGGRDGATQAETDGLTDGNMGGLKDGQIDG